MSAWASWVVSPTKGTAHLLAVEGPEFLTTHCRRTLPSGLLRHARVPSGHLCQTCVAAYSCLSRCSPTRSRLATGTAIPPHRLPVAPGEGRRSAKSAVQRIIAAQQYLDHLTTTVELTTARLALWELIALADEAPTLPDDQLRARLIDLAETARPRQRPAPRWRPITLTPIVVSAPLTLDELIAHLIQFRALYPDQAPQPVLLLNTDDDGDGLVTDIDLDCFDEEQGRVTVLLSRPMP